VTNDRSGRRVERPQLLQVRLPADRFAMTGPTPGWISRSTPIALSGSTMSLKKMAASTP